MQGLGFCQRLGAAVAFVFLSIVLGGNAASLPLFPRTDDDLVDTACVSCYSSFDFIFMLISLGSWYM